MEKDFRPKVKRMNLNIGTDLHNAFKAAVSARGTNMSDVLLEFIYDYVQKYGVKPAGKAGRK